MDDYNIEKLILEYNKEIEGINKLDLPEEDKKQLKRFTLLDYEYWRRFNSDVKKFLKKMI